MDGLVYQINEVHKFYCHRRKHACIHVGGGVCISIQPLLHRAHSQNCTVAALNIAGVILGWWTIMSQWIQHWHQEGYHHPNNNVTLVFSKTDRQLFQGQSARTSSIVSSHWKQGEVWLQAGPRMTHRLTDTLCCIPKIFLHRNKTVVLDQGFAQLHLWLSKSVWAATAGLIWQ